MRRFELHRDSDETGVSGTGIVAEGVQWDDGSCAMRWRTATTSTAIYASAEAVVAIHGHGGTTRLVWVDAQAGYPDGDELVPLCVMCFGGPPDDRSGWGWCSDCGASAGLVMLPKWAANSIRQHDRQRIEASEQHRHRAEHLTETLRVVRLGMARRATEAFDALLVGRPAVNMNVNSATSACPCFYAGQYPCACPARS